MDYFEFSEGEKFVQQQAHEEEMAFQNGAIIKDTVPAQLFPFIKKQQLFFVASMDGQGKVWASVLSGHFNLIAIENPGYLILEPLELTSYKGDIFWKNIQFQSAVGMLFIDLVTRFRFRVNGSITRQRRGWKIEIEQAFSNCPKYIQRRKVSNGIAGTASFGNDLKSWVSSADTLFVASSNKFNKLDISHRGGKPGFIEWLDDDTIRIPDYAGNSMFMTMGNFYEDPSAGILIIDFNNGETVQMSGDATIHLGEPTPDIFVGRTNRYWDFKIREVRFNHTLHNFSAVITQYSPFNPD